jgi:hypothetical protein
VAVEGSLPPLWAGVPCAVVRRRARVAVEAAVRGGCCWGARSAR